MLFQAHGHGKKRKKIILVQTELIHFQSEKKNPHAFSHSSKVNTGEGGWGRTKTLSESTHSESEIPECNKKIRERKILEGRKERKKEKKEWGEKIKNTSKGAAEWELKKE